MKTAFLYAGQGSQRVGMGRDLYAASPAFRKAFDAAELDFDLHALCFNGPQETLNQTQYTQPCMVAFACGVTAALVRRGHSSGLRCRTEPRRIQRAGSLRRVRRESRNRTGRLSGRGNGQRERRREQRDDRRAHARPRIAGALLRRGGRHGAHLQLQLSRTDCHRRRSGCRRRAGELAKAAGARRLLPLRVSRPVPHAADAAAAKALHERFKTEPFGEMQISVLFNCLGQEKGSETISSLLERQVVSPVMMEDTLRELARLGVDTFVEIGPGTALSGFVRKTLGASVNCYNIENVDGLEKTVDALKA